MNYLITGGAGFIGSNFLHYVVKKYPNDNFICLDDLTYAGNNSTLFSILKYQNFKFIKGNINDYNFIDEVFKKDKIDIIINFAAESHVDNSIHRPDIFIKTNIEGTFNLLEIAKKYKIKRFHQISTDEVYGDMPLESDIRFNELSSLKPFSPYSASKASADLLVMSYYRTYGLPISISRCMDHFNFQQNLFQ